ncbi:MAG: hypothetical protein DI604_31850 [Delftia acidovorans]|nr:MAG: hypothetical protein DI604_31850 [Delftia acidovorans]
MKNTLNPIKDEFRGDTASLVCNIVALLEMDAKGALVPHGVGGHARDLLSAAAVRLAEASPAVEAPSIRAGLLAAAVHIQAKAAAYAEECGSYDPDTGAFEMRDAVQEYFNTLDELAEEIRLMAGNDPVVAPAAPLSAPFAYTVRWSDAQPGDKPVIFWPEQLERYGVSMQREGHAFVPLYKGAEPAAPFDIAQRRNHYEALLAQLGQAMSKEGSAA